MGVYDLGRSIYEQEPQVYPLAKVGSDYKPSPALIRLPSHKAGIALQIDDYMNGSTNTLAIQQISWTLDGDPQGTIILDDIGYEETRYLNAYADYKTHFKKGYWLQCLFRLPENGLGKLYHDLLTENGMVMLPDDGPHKLEITLTDNSGNTAQVSCSLQYGGPQVNPHTCKTFFDESPFRDFRIEMQKGSLYDAVCSATTVSEEPGAFSRKFNTGRSEVPLHTATKISIQRNKPVPFALRNKLVMRYSDGKSTNGSAATPDSEGFYSARLRTLGSYWLVADTTGPEISSTNGKNSNKATAKELSFRASDKLSSIAKFEAKLDGKWILLEQHGSRFFYRFDDHCGKGKHELIFSAQDENGNTNSFTYTFTR